MRRVRNYNTFLKENKLTSHIASKNMAKILDPDSSRSVRAKGKAEIDSSFGDEENPVWDAFSWVESKNGYAGITPIFSGEVVLRELIEDESVSRRYEVTTGTNTGFSGNFSWGGESGKTNEKYPVFDSPIGKKWADVLGPDEDFLKAFVSDGYRWSIKVSEISAIKIKKVSEKGVCELIYEDKYQFYGNVRIYYSGNTGSNFHNSYYSYEVTDGPNKGTKGTGLQIFTQKEVSEKIGIYNPFSDGDKTLSSIQYPPDDGSSNKDILPGLGKGKGVSDFQFIFLNTSSLSLIKAPTKEEFYYPGSNSSYNESKAFKAFENINTLKNIIFGKLDKNNLAGKKVYTIKGGKVTYFDAKDLTPLDKLDGNTSGECYVSHYQGNPLLLYTVSCKDKDSPSFDNKGVGTYGNNFFSGVFYSGNESQPWIFAKGEWYYDYALDQIGIIYAYDCITKKEIDLIKNLAVFELKIEKPDFTNPLDKSNKGIIRDQSGGSWPTPIKPKELNIPSIDDYFKKK